MAPRGTVCSSQIGGALAPNEISYLVARHFNGVGFGSVTLASYVLGTELVSAQPQLSSAGPDAARQSCVRSYRHISSTHTASAALAA
jgi:hypothetical protein